MCILLRIIPQEIIDDYNLTELITNQGCIYMQIKKGVYGLKQAGIFANQEFVKHMNMFGYNPVQHTPGLWVHDSRRKKLSYDQKFLCSILLNIGCRPFFKIPQSQIPHHIQHGSDSLYQD